MKYLVIIATRDWEKWSKASNPRQEKLISSKDYTLHILRKKGGRTGNNFKDLIRNIPNFDGLTDTCELGVIFHDANSDDKASKFKNNLTENCAATVTFCAWYSSGKKDFWNQSNNDDNKPYNNLIKAWVNDSGSKDEAFDAVWNFFIDGSNFKSRISLHKAIVLERLKGKQNEEILKAISRGAPPFEGLKETYDILKKEDIDDIDNLDNILDFISKQVMKE